MVVCFVLYFVVWVYFIVSIGQAIISLLFHELITFLALI